MGAAAGVEDPVDDERVEHDGRGRRARRHAQIGGGRSGDVDVGIEVARARR
jgi:hypothetical protein